ncbi:glycerate kinase type-2 family protein [Kaarinaea lacus]
MQLSSRQQLEHLFQQAIAAVQGDRCVERWLNRHPIVGPVHLIAVGKAAASMAQGAIKSLPEHIEEGLLITKTGHCQPFDHRIQCLEAAHPVPDESSLRAGNQLLHFIQAIPLHSQVLVLISGGTSSLVEVLPQDISLQDWRQTTQWLLGHSYSIDQVNYVRKRLSCIKAGRLAHYFADRRVICLMISDVPKDDPSIIGSGLLVPERQQDDTCIKDLPDSIAQFIHRAPPLPVCNDPCFKTIRTELVATLADAKRAAEAAAHKLGLPTHYHEAFIDGDAVEMGRALAEQLLQGPTGLHIWGGETTVRLPDNPGQGGRNQSLALAAAEVLHGHPGVFLLSAGTDGTDGPGEYAGAIVDGETASRGLKTLPQGRSIAWHLEHADAGTFLQASGDLIRTGPTGTNVMDLILGLKVAH